MQYFPKFLKQQHLSLVPPSPQDFQLQLLIAPSQGERPTLRLESSSVFMYLRFLSVMTVEFILCTQTPQIKPPKRFQM